MAMLMTSGLVVLIYEINARFLFVRYLYQARWLAFLLGSAGLLASVHLLTYLGYPMLQAAARLPESRIAADEFPRSLLLYWYKIHESGPLGWMYSWDIVSRILGNLYLHAGFFLIISLIRQYLFVGFAVQQAELDNMARQQENNLLEMELLKAQLNPHFLFNSLNSIYARVAGVDDQAADLVLRLAELMRYSLYEADSSVVSLDQELNYIDNYLQLEQARHGQRVDILFSREGNVGHFTIAPLILLAFIEDAFKHGVGGQQPAAYVWVEARIEQEQTLVFTVQNSLATSAQRHFPEQKTDAEGLPNARERLALLYPHAHSVEVERETDSYGVTLRLQLTTDLPEYRDS